MHTAPWLIADLWGEGATPSAWTLTMPDGTPMPPGSERITVPVRTTGLDDAALRRLREEIGRLRMMGVAPLLVLSGHPGDQLALLARLRELDLGSKVRSVLSVSAHHRPLLALRQSFVHGLIIDTPATGAEQRHWARALKDGAGQRVQTVPPLCVPCPTAQRGRSSTSARASVALVAFEGDPFMALGIQAFTCWSQGRYARCSACTTLSLDRFAPHRARFESRQDCLHCGSRCLVRAAADPSLRLSIHLGAGSEPSPDPAVLADWLGLGDRLEVQHLPTGADAAHLVEAYASADVALVLNDPAYPDLRLAAARASGARVVSNVAAQGASALPACHSWDGLGQVTAYPSLPALLRALIGAFQTGRPDREDPAPEPTPNAALPASEAMDRHTQAWQHALERLAAMPAPRPRLFRPRPSSSR